jgi:hypothetical protein
LKTRPQDLELPRRCRESEARLAAKLGKLGDLPTIKVVPERLAAYARRADDNIRSGRPASSPEIEVSIELEEVPTAVRRSDVLPIARSLQGVDLGAVPVISVSREDLAWFELDADTYALIAMIDGHTTVADLLSSVAVEPARAMVLLQDLELQRVIALA